MVLPYIDMNPPRMYMCSTSWTPLPPPSPYHPSGSAQCTSPEHPVSCIEPGQAVCFTYGNIHVSMPFSQIIPPSPLPTESKGLFYISVSLLLSHIQCYCYHLSKFHIYVLVYCIGIFVSGLLHNLGHPEINWEFTRYFNYIFQRIQIGGENKTSVTHSEPKRHKWED